MREFYPESERGKSKLDWLESNFSFSFANYYNPNRMGFGTLRVINNDTVSAGNGFGMHKHSNMEIITIALNGSLTHKDSLGNTEILIPGEVQSMSAGTGILHSEINEGTADGEFFQIWIETKENNISPQYSQKSFSDIERKNVFQLLAGTNQEGENVLINQNAYISRSTLNEGEIIKYTKYDSKNGIYIMNIFGVLSVGEYILRYRDALSVTDENSIKILANNDSDFFVIEVPMK